MPEDMLAQHAAVVSYFHPDRGEALALSSNASVIGGYAESLAATLFVPSVVRGWRELWRTAVGYKASAMGEDGRRERREMLGLTGRSHDKFDLYIPLQDFRLGRWASVTPPGEERASFERLRALGLQPAQPSHVTCQVKARFAWQDLEYDALPYSVYIDTASQSWSRDDVLSGMAWREEAPDLVVWVRFGQHRGRVRTAVRLATAEDVRLAICALMHWEIQNGDRRTASNRYSWTGHKINFNHVFGGVGWRQTEGMSAETESRVQRHGTWSQWAIGLDVSRALAPGRTPRPRLPVSVADTRGLTSALGGARPR